MAGFSINVVVISGNLTRDPELRSLPNGTPVCELGIAVNERIKNATTSEWEDRPNYVDVTVWSGMGEWAARNLSKGSGVTVEGRLRFESWEKDGQKRSKLKVVANSVVPRDGGGGGSNAGSAPAGDSNDFGAPTGGGGSFGVPTGGGSHPDDDIPF